MVDADRIAATLGGPRVFRERSATYEKLMDRVKKGLPYAALDAVATRFEIPQQTLVRVLHVPPRTLARRKQERRLRPDESDRLLRLSRVAALAEDVLGSRQRAAAWLRKPNRALGGAVPLEHLSTDIGAQQVEDVLFHIEYGLYS